MVYARTRMGERTTRVRIYVRTYVYTWGVRGREHARKKDTYVRTYVRTLEYVRTCVRTRQGGHARNKDTLEYVRTHGRSERGNRELRVARQRKALRRYVRTYVRTYVREDDYFFWNPHSVLIASVNQGTYGRTYAGSASNGTRSSPPTGSCTPTS